MSNLATYQFDEFPIRIVTDDLGQPWFNANDMCAVLGYSNPHDAVGRHVDGDDLGKHEVIDGMGRAQLSNHVNESGMYSLILGSTKAEAKRFKKWVTADVLPSIRKTGSYTALRKPRAAVSDEVRALAIVRREIVKVPGVKPEMATAVFLQAVEKATGLPVTEMRLALPGAALEEAKKLNPTQIAAALANGTSARAINQALIDLKLQDKTERGYVITDAGIAHGEMTPFNRNGHSGYQPLWFESVIEPLRQHFAARSNVVSIQ